MFGRGQPFLSKISARRCAPSFGTLHIHTFSPCRTAPCSTAGMIAKRRSMSVVPTADALSCTASRPMHNTHKPRTQTAGDDSSAVFCRARPPGNAKKEAPHMRCFIGFRQRPILPDRLQSSTFGTEGLNFCVRNGNRWDPFVITTGNCELFCFREPDLSVKFP